MMGKAHQQIINECRERLRKAGIKSPNKWIEKSLDISPNTLTGWITESDKSWARTPHCHSIRLLEILVDRTTKKSQTKSTSTTRIRWSKTDDEFLAENYSSHGPIFCAASLNRTISAVHARASILKEKTNKPYHFSAQEDDYLVKHYQGMGARHCSEKLGRSIKSIANRAIKLNITKTRRPWSNDEEKLLINSYRKHGAKYCAQKLGRSVSAVVARASLLNHLLKDEINNEDNG